MFGAFQFGAAFFADAPTQVRATITRDDVGGVWGTATFGQPYFGRHLVTSAPVIIPQTRDNLGGIWGTATFGQPYFAGHNTLAIAPPPPIEPGPVPDERAVISVESGHAWIAPPNTKRKPKKIDEEDEEIALMLGLMAARHHGRN